MKAYQLTAWQQPPRAPRGAGPRARTGAGSGQGRGRRRLPFRPAPRGPAIGPLASGGGERRVDAASDHVLGRYPEQVGLAAVAATDADSDPCQVHRAQALGPQQVGGEVGVVEVEDSLGGAAAEDPRELVDAVGDAPAEPQPHRLRDALAQGRRRLLHQRQRAVEEGRVAQAEVRVGVGAAGQGRHRVRRLGGRGAQVGVELGEVVGDGEHEQLLLRGEVSVDQPAGDPRRLRDLLDRSLLHAALVEQGPGGLDEIGFPTAARGDPRCCLHLAPILLRARPGGQA
jgi:hypothetical protein